MGDHSDLKHSEAEKKAAARRIHEHLGPDTHKAGILADEDTAKVTGRGAEELREWDIASGLKRRHRDWERHAKQLEKRLQEEQAGLADANRVIQDGDILTGNGLHGAGNTPLLRPGHSGAVPPPYHSKLDEL